MCASHILCISFVSISLILTIALWVGPRIFHFMAKETEPQKAEVKQLVNGRVRTQVLTVGFQNFSS